MRKFIPLAVACAALGSFVVQLALTAPDFVPRAGDDVLISRTSPMDCPAPPHDGSPAACFLHPN